MKLNIPNIVHDIDLSEYDDAMKGQKLFVWVNPPSSYLVEMGKKFNIVNDKERLPELIELLEKRAGTKQEGEKDEELIAEYKERLKEADKKEHANAHDEYLGLLSELLSKGNKDTHYSVDNLKEVKAATEDTDPRFWDWFQTRVIEEVNAHRLGQKKG